MLHQVIDAELPGAAPIGKPCPGCKRSLPPQAGGYPDAPALLRKPTVEELHKKALAGNPRPLLKYLDPTRYPPMQHGSTVTDAEETQQRPCPVSHFPAWLLAHCRTVDEVFDWEKKLKRWWTPTPPNAP
ncbi:hypothetical protein [Streptomyces sp. NPDC093568]|uniref:hypothetical protein n=1 Tax=Streptomyces sp. NPDC093568 TaxID=3366041 RepID=UPI003808E2F5